MKTICAVIMALGCLALATPSRAQRPGGFWVVEGNINQSTYSMVHFYDENSQLIGEEKVTGKWSKLSSRKNVRTLNRKLRKIQETESPTTREGRKGKKESRTWSGL